MIKQVPYPSPSNIRHFFLTPTSLLLDLTVKDEE